LKRTAVALVVFASSIAAACGGGGGAPGAPLTPTPAAAIPPAEACGLIAATSIVNGASCPAETTRVVKLNMRQANGTGAGSCSGTIIAPRAILTAAHCLDEDTAVVRVFLGTGLEIVADSFVKHPGWNGQVGSIAPDVGVVLMKEDLGRPPVPLLLSRNGSVGEQVIVAGWGRDQNDVTATFRAGFTTLSAVTPLYLQTLYSATASSICSGDSGGPLFLQENGVWSVAGVTSASTDTVCTTGTNFYVSVQHATIKDFILEHVRDAATR
jgi:hypothetical protein